MLLPQVITSHAVVIKVSVIHKRKDRRPPCPRARPNRDQHAVDDRWGPCVIVTASPTAFTIDPVVAGEVVLSTNDPKGVPAGCSESMIPSPFASTGGGDGSTFRQEILLSENVGVVRIEVARRGRENDAAAVVGDRREVCRAVALGAPVRDRDERQLSCVQVLEVRVPAAVEIRRVEVGRVGGERRKSTVAGDANVLPRDRSLARRPPVETPE